MTGTTWNDTLGAQAPGVPDHLARNPAWREAFERATQPGYEAWLNHVRAAAGCTRPVRLIGSLHTVKRDADGLGATLLGSTDTATLPDAVIYKACGNRRATVCPSCSRTYQHDAYQLIRAGLAGGRGIPASVAEHPAVFATFTAPSFGAVHTHVVKTHSCRDRNRCGCRPRPCHHRRDAGNCSHGHQIACNARHAADDRRLGQPLCLDCYDHNHQVVWNLYSGELWRRTKQVIERHLAQLAKQRGIPSAQVLTAGGKTKPVAPVRVAHGKVAEFQHRAAVHFHGLLRLDGVNPDDPEQPAPPPAGITVDDLAEAINAAASTSFTTPPHPDQPEGWPIAWGEQLDIRIVVAGEIIDGKVAGYLAKYATKSTETTGHLSARITSASIDLHMVGDSHTARLVNACWTLGRPLPGHTASENPYLRLRRWAHMLGYGGHFLTKARRYSATFAAIRAERTIYRRTHDPDAAPLLVGQVDSTMPDATTVVALLGYAGTGWRTNGDALLANSAAALAREHARVGREEATLAPAQLSAT